MMFETCRQSQARATTHSGSGSYRKQSVLRRKTGRAWRLGTVMHESDMCYKMRFVRGYLCAFLRCFCCDVVLISVVTVRCSTKPFKFHSATAYFLSRSSVRGHLRTHHAVHARDGYTTGALIRGVSSHKERPWIHYRSALPMYPNPPLCGKSRGSRSHRPSTSS
jgi:hypothetical protein